MIRGPIILLLSLPSFVPAGAARADDPAGRLLVWAPGYPGSGEQAATTMQELAAAMAESSAGIERLEALYEPSLDRGLELVADRRTVLAIVPAHVFWRYGAELGLEPMLEIVPAGGEGEIWSLVARAGAVDGPAALAGWEIHGLAGVAPDFVRGPVLGAWGELPAGTTIVFTPAVRSALRRAAQGEPIAVLLDRRQLDALPALPFSGDLEVLVRSPLQPSSFLCTVRGRLDAERARRLGEAARGLSDLSHGREALAAMRIERMVPAEKGWGPPR